MHTNIVLLHLFYCCIFFFLFSLQQIVGVTCTDDVHPLLRRQTFDVCIVVDASKISQTVLRSSLLPSNKFILFGDRNESSTNPSNAADRSIFDWMYTTENCLEYNIEMDNYNPLSKQ